MVMDRETARFPYALSWIATLYESLIIATSSGTSCVRYYILNHLMKFCFHSRDFSINFLRFIIFLKM